MVETAEKRMTIAEFLQWDDGSDTRYELVRGKVIAMAPPSARHSVIVSKIGGVLEAGLKGPCYVGMNAGIIRPDRDDTFYEADLVVSRTPLETASTIPHPTERPWPREPEEKSIPGTFFTSGWSPKMLPSCV